MFSFFKDLLENKDKSVGTKFVIVVAFSAPLNKAKFNMTVNLFNLESLTKLNQKL